jgi:hypothetical protein
MEEGERKRQSAYMDKTSTYDYLGFSCVPVGY